MGAETVVLVLAALIFGAQTQNINWRSNFPSSSTGCSESGIFDVASKKGPCDSFTVLDTRLPNSINDCKTPCETTNGNYGNLGFTTTNQKYSCTKAVAPCENSNGVGNIGLTRINQNNPCTAVPEVTVCNSIDRVSKIENPFSKSVIATECAPRCNSISDTLSGKLANPLFNRITQPSCETPIISEAVTPLFDFVTTRPSTSFLNRNNLNLETCEKTLGTSANSIQNRLFPISNSFAESVTSCVSEQPGFLNRPSMICDVTSRPCSTVSEIACGPCGTTVSETPSNCLANRPVNSLPCIEIGPNRNTALSGPIFEAFPVNNLPCLENIKPICNSVTEIPKCGVSLDTFTSRPSNRIFEAFPSIKSLNSACQSKITPYNVPLSNINIPNIETLRSCNNIPQCNSFSEGLGCSCNNFPKRNTFSEGLGCSCNNFPKCNTFDQGLGCPCNLGTPYCNQVIQPLSSNPCNQVPSIISTTIVDNGACNTLANALQLMILKDFVRDTQNLQCGCGTLGCGVCSPYNEVVATGPCVLDNVQGCVCGDVIDVCPCDVPCNDICKDYGYGCQGFPEYGYGCPEFDVVNSILNCRGKPLPDMLTTLLGCQFPELGLGYPGLPINPYALPEVVTPGCPCVPEFQPCGCNLPLADFQNCGNCGPSLPFIPGLPNDLSCPLLGLSDCNNAPYANVPCLPNDCYLIPQAGCNNLPIEFPQLGFSGCNNLPPANVPCLPNDLFVSPLGVSGCNNILANSPCIPNDLTISPLGYFGCDNLPLPCLPNQLPLGSQGFSDCYNLPLANVPIIPNDLYLSPLAYPGCNSVLQENICTVNEVPSIQSISSSCNSLLVTNISSFSNELRIPGNNCGSFVNLPSPKFPSPNKKASITSIMKPNCNTPKECTPISNIETVVTSPQCYQGSCETVLSSPQCYQGSCETVSSSPLCYRGSCDSLCVNSFSPTPELIPFGVTVLPGPCECYSGLQSQATPGCFTGLPEAQFLPKGPSGCFTGLPEAQFLSQGPSGCYTGLPEAQFLSQGPSGCFTGLPEAQFLSQGLSGCFTGLPEAQFVSQGPSGCFTGLPEAQFLSQGPSGWCSSYPEIQPLPQVSCEAPIIPGNGFNTSPNCVPASVNIPDIAYQCCGNIDNINSYQHSPCNEQNVPLLYQAPVTYIETPSFTEPTCVTQEIAPITVNLELSQPSCAPQVIPTSIQECCNNIPSFPDLNFNCYYDCPPIELSLSDIINKCGSPNQAGFSTYQSGCSPYQAEVLIPSSIPAQLVIDPECLPNAYLTIDPSSFGY